MTTITPTVSTLVALATADLRGATRAALNAFYRGEVSADLAALFFCNAVAFGDAEAPAGIDCRGSATVAARLRDDDDGDAVFYTLLGAVGG
jgi:hypothetical protein